MDLHPSCSAAALDANVSGKEVPKATCHGAVPEQDMTPVQHGQTGTPPT